MKAAFILLFALALVSTENPREASATASVAARAAYNLSVDASWTARISERDPAKLQLNVVERKGSTLGTAILLADLEGLNRADLNAGKLVTFALRREAGPVTFTGRFRDGRGEGTLRYVGDAGYWARIAAMGVRNDWSERRYQLLALPLLDVRADYIAALRREGAIGELSDYVGMKAVNVLPELVHEVRPLIAGELKAHDLMSFAALGVTPHYARAMKGAFPRLAASELSSLKALGVTADYIATMRDAGARIRSASDAQSFRALGISPAAVKRTVDRGRTNPTVSDVMEVSVRY